LFELASDEGGLDSWQQRLSLAAAIADDASMKALLEQPNILPRELGELFLSVLAGAGLESDSDFNNAIRLLAENSRLAALPAIVDQFATLKQEAEGKIEVKVRSAQELSAEQQDRIAQSMAKRLGKEVSISAEIDDSLIAGAVITAGDLVIDGSASGRIEKLSLAVNK
jgi:F-type H+-transporting ATPase subunit delta